MTILLIASIAVLILWILCFTMFLVTIFSDTYFVDLNINACIAAFKVIDHVDRASELPALKDNAQIKADLLKMVDELGELIPLSNKKRDEFSQAKTRKEKRHYKCEVKKLSKEMLQLSEKILHTVPV